MGLFSSIAKIASPVASIAGALIGNAGQESANDDNLEYQRQFAKEGLQWRVEDAKAAGLHPLAALGANIPGFSPSFQSGSLGQDISRAVEATATAFSRNTSRVATELALEKASLENDLLRSQITAVNRPSNPPFPSGNHTGDVQINPDTVTSTRFGDTSTTASYPKPAVTEFMNRDGSITRWPSPEAKNAIEDSLYEYEHMYKNRIHPWVQRQVSGISDAYRRTWWNPSNWKRR